MKYTFRRATHPYRTQIHHVFEGDEFIGVFVYAAGARDQKDEFELYDAASRRDWFDVGFEAGFKAGRDVE